MNKTSFHLTFGTEVVIPVKIRFLIMQIEHFDEATNSDWLWTNLDRGDSGSNLPTDGSVLVEGCSILWLLIEVGDFHPRDLVLYISKSQGLLNKASYLPTGKDPTKYLKYFSKELIRMKTSMELLSLKLGILRIFEYTIDNVITFIWEAKKYSSAMFLEVS